jgi:hypothetical protein
MKNSLSTDSSPCVTHIILCDDERHFELRRAGVLQTSERSLVVYRGQRPDNALVLNTGEPINCSDRRTLTVFVLESSDEEALQLAIRITDQWVRSFPLRTFGSVHVQNRKLGK